MTANSNEAIFEKIKDMPRNEACVFAVRNFWNTATNEDAIKLMKIYDMRKNECITDEDRFELLIALYNEYKATENRLALRFAKIIAKGM